MSAALELFWMLLVHLALTGLPGAFGVLLAARRGVRSLPILLAIGVAASGVSAMIAFWAYFLDPLVGQVASFLIVLGSAQGIALCRPDRLDRGLLRGLAVPAVLWALGSAFVLYFGFLYGGGAEPLVTAAQRFSHPLPSDNDIPRYFAAWFYEHGHAGPPLPFADWLSSDRPPLQIGYVLAQRPFGWDETGLRYQVLGVVVQQIWIVAMWALLCAARLRPPVRGLAMLAAIVSDVGILYGFFVWPKLIAAAFLFAALALVVSDQWPSLRRSAWGAALFGGLCALAMLSHGASAFGLVPLLAVAVWRGGLPAWRWLGVAAAVGAILLGPWAAYQRLADPPGDRLLKWQLGGSLVIDDRSAFGTIADGYREAGFGGSLENRWRNLTEIGGWDRVGPLTGAVVRELRGGNVEPAIEATRTARFFSLGLLLLPFLLAPLAMLFARARGRPRGEAWSFALLALAFAGIGTLVWALLMFGDPESSAIVHVGSVAIPLVAIVGCVAGMYAVSPRGAIALVGVAAVATLIVYAPGYDLPPDAGRLSPLALFLCAAALAGVLGVLHRSARGGSAARRG